MNIIFGLILMAVGTLVIMKSEVLFRNFGRIAWFEKNFGSEGGSRLGYKLMGLVVVFFGLLLTTGTLNGFMNAILSPLIRK